MRVSNDKQFPMNPIAGEPPHILWGATAPVGTVEPQASAPIGSLYILKLASNVRLYSKTVDNNADADWSPVTGTTNSSVLEGQGSTTTPITTATAGKNFLGYYVESTATSGDARGMYLRLYLSGAGGSGEAARIFATINNKAVATGGTVNGAHISIGTAGASAAVSGAANALRCTFGIAALSTNIGGTCSVIQVDTDMPTEVTVPPNFAFMRFVNLGVKKAAALFRIPNVVAETAGLFCAHTTDAMTHSIRIVSEGGTAYYLMATTTVTNRTVS